MKYFFVFAVITLVFEKVLIVLDKLLCFAFHDSVSKISENKVFF